MSKFLSAASAVVALSLVAAPAHAVVSRITFTGDGFAHQYVAPGDIYAVGTITSSQQALLDGFYNFGGPKPFSITFEYDTAATGSGGLFAASLISANINGATNLFDGFSASLKQEQVYFAPTRDALSFILRKSAHGSPTATTAAYFTITDRQGGLFTDVNTLPSDVIDVSIIDDVGIGIELQGGRYQLSGGGGTGTFPITASLAPAPSTGGVPEPATWAMMLIGFFGLGGLVRRQRRALATA